MSSKPQALLVALTWMVMLVQTGLAQLPPPPSQPDSVLGIPGLFPPGTPKEVLQCWSSLTDTRGCVVAIFSSILSLNFGNIGQACCESFVKISSDCWPKMFPLNPLFAPLHNSTCAALIGKMNTYGYISHEKQVEWGNSATKETGHGGRKSRTTFLEKAMELPRSYLNLPLHLAKHTA
ncbi:hypothetical protein FEM48_Zijuj10G0013800 [Ziziphus jujuba var. spinosa]|uniref:Prolamin-like domain-containing protein n=1 Tax=Ziziphus jujuba var. spinosa TaxID=714518 RepID=A0A978UKG5_ZIZJJ|nr:hypothetical protein FEM48_Zijuj10G0013800 [Ziziphus jujuba var. spinosa]